MISTTKLIRDRITHFKRGKIFFLSDFADLGSSNTIRKTISRFCDEGIIIRSGRGIYTYPKIDKYFGLGNITASNDEIAKAYAKRKGDELYLTTTAAQNLLGLDTQNQTKTVYLTNGRTATIKTNNEDVIKLIHTADKTLSKYRSKQMQLLNIALSGYQNKIIDINTRKKIKRIVSNVDKSDYKNDIKLMSTWKRDLIYAMRQENS